MDLLIDTNIILDMVLKREKYQLIVLFFKTIENIGAKAYITATTVTDLFYIIQRQTNNVGRTYTIMENVFKIVSVLSVTDEDIQMAFEREWKDFENSEGNILLPEQWIAIFAE